MTSQPHRIWGVTELVELIMLHLPVRDILFSQRVCSKWKDIIAESPDIRRALFLPPHEEVTVAQLQIKLEHIPKKLAKEKMPDYSNLRLLANPLPRPYWFQESTPKGLPTGILVNPLLARFVTWMVADGREGAGRCTVYGRQCIALHPDRARGDVLRNSPATASWRKMLLMQPTAVPLRVQLFPRQQTIERTMPIGARSFGLEWLLELHDDHEAWSNKHFAEPQPDPFSRWGPPQRERYVLGLCTGMHWVLGFTRVDGLRKADWERCASEVTGLEVIRAAAEEREKAAHALLEMDAATSEEDRRDYEHLVERRLVPYFSLREMGGQVE